MNNQSLENLSVESLCEKTLRKANSFKESVLKTVSAEKLAVAYIVAKRMLRSVEAKAQPSERVISTWESNLNTVVKVANARAAEIVTINTVPRNKKEQELFAELKGNLRNAVAA